MSDVEKRVRAAAQELHDAVVEARKAGFNVTLPASVEQLPAIAVSATGRAGQGGEAASAAPPLPPKAAAPAPQPARAARPAEKTS